MVSAWRPARAICAALVFAGAAVSGASSAQSPIDVPTLTTIAPQEEAPSAGAPRSSFDYETRTATATAPWDAPRTPWNAKPGALASASPSATPALRPTGFIGAATPLACRPAAYYVILDKTSDIRAGTLCFLPDGSWRMLP